MMASRRDRITIRRTSPDIAALGRNRSQMGITTWFETMVARAMLSTITIDVALENPPRKASIANVPCPSAKGSVSMNMSGLAPSGIRSSPITAMGMMNRLISSR